MGGRREVSISSHRPVTSSDLKHERLFFLGECLNIFATGCSTLQIEPPLQSCQKVFKKQADKE